MGSVRAGAGPLPTVLRALAVTACIGGAFAARAEAQDVRRLTVEESVRMGLQHNAGLRAVRADAVAAEAVQRQVGAARLPALRSQATYTRLSDNIPAVEFTLPGVDSTFTFQGVQLDRVHTELSVQLPLLSQLRLGHESRAAAHEAAAAELSADQEQSDVAFEIRRAYWELVRALAVRSSVEGALDQVDEHLSVVRSRVDEGTALTRDLLRAQTRRSEVLLERVEAENAVRVGQLELNRLIGLPLDEPTLPTSEAALDAGAPLPGPARLTAALGERPQIGALEQQVLGLREQLGAAAARRFPEVDLVGRWMYAQPNPYFFVDQDRFRGSWELGLAASWGIWEGGRVSARRREMAARVEAAEARLAETTERMAVEVARRSLEVDRAAEAVEVAAQNVREAEESYRVVREQFGEGVALSADVLDAEDALRRARARRERALADHAIARAAVMNAIGRAW